MPLVPRGWDIGPTIPMGPSPWPSWNGRSHGLLYKGRPLYIHTSSNIYFLPVTQLKPAKIQILKLVWKKSKVKMISIWACIFNSNSPKKLECQKKCRNKKHSDNNSDNSLTSRHTDTKNSPSNFSPPSNNWAQLQWTYKNWYFKLINSCAKTLSSILSHFGKKPIF